MLAKVETAHRDNCPFLVLETADGAAAGYACADRFRPLDANRLAELSIYLAPEFTGRGRGSPLLERLVGELKQRNFYAGLMAIITADNAPSLRFHRSHGFEDAGLWKNAAFKFGGWCDVLAQIEMTRPYFPSARRAAPTAASSRVSVRRSGRPNSR